MAAPVPRPSRSPTSRASKRAGAARGDRERAGILRPRLKVWVVLDSRVKFGDGRAELLNLIDETGSLRQAVRRLGMSYRAAWGYLRELERAAGAALLERHPGGGGSGGMRLTREGRSFLARYRKFRGGLDTLVARHFVRSFHR